MLRTTEAVHSVVHPHEQVIKMKLYGLQQLAQLIYAHCGLHFFSNLSMLERKMERRIEELHLSHIEYCQFIQNHPEEWDKIIEILTINETYFYREEHQLQEFQVTVLPNLKERITHRPLRIWSAACSTGEEPYTLSMLALETGLFSTDSFRIFATDINHHVLRTAQRGVYGKHSLSFRRMPQVFLDKYFQVTEKGFEIAEKVKEPVTFQQLNLLECNNYGQFYGMDIIFCRNVFIYFDQETNRKVISQLYDMLSPGGYLFLGHADTITGIDIELETISTSNTFYYRKGVSDAAIWSSRR